MDKFNRRFPGWEYGETGDDFPWAEIAVNLVDHGTKRQSKKNLPLGAARISDYPWHIVESSNLIQDPSYAGVSPRKRDDETAKTIASAALLQPSPDHLSPRRSYRKPMKGNSIMAKLKSISPDDSTVARLSELTSRFTDSDIRG